MDRSAVQAWLVRYVEAWKSYDRTAIEALFAPDATYRYHPYDNDALQGRDAIVTSWLENRDVAGTYEGRYEPYAVEGDRAVAKGTSTYWTDASKATLARVYDNVYLLGFDGEGRCTSFTEYFMQEPGAKSAPTDAPLSRPA